MPETGKNMKTSFFGIYNRVLGKSVVKIAKSHENVLQKGYTNQLGVDMMETLKTMRPEILEFDKIFTAKAFGFKDRDDYYEKAACINQIPNIKTPTFFMSA